MYSKRTLLKVILLGDSGYVSSETNRVHLDAASRLRDPDQPNDYRKHLPVPYNQKELSMLTQYVLQYTGLERRHCWKGILKTKTSFSIIL